MSNVISAIMAAGFQPGVVRVNADGSFSVEVAGNTNEAPSGQNRSGGQPRGANADEAPEWEDGL